VSIACEGFSLHGHIVPYASRAGFGTLKLGSPGCRALRRASSLTPLLMYGMHYTIRATAPRHWTDVVMRVYLVLPLLNRSSF